MNLPSPQLYVSISWLIFNLSISSSQLIEFVRPTCSSATCRFGSCEQLDFDFRCHCSPGVKGILCDRLLEENDNLCLSHPCWNGGVCRQVGNDFVCDCPVGSLGKDCRTIENTLCLTNNPCLNGGICRALSANDLVCSCVGDFEGVFCESTIPLCERKDPCENGGICVKNKCNCPLMFTGEFCQKRVVRTAEKKVIIVNKGAYIANLRLDYTLNVGFAKLPITQTGSILLGQSYAFFIPFSVDFEQEPGVVLTVDAVAGTRVLKKNIVADPECFHVWGTTFIPFWSTINC